MSDSCEAVVDIECGEDSAPLLANRVVERLVKVELILPEVDAEACLGGEVAYRPGRRIPTVYRRSPQEGRFWTLRTNGMEVETGRWVNQFGFTQMQHYTCPHCGTRFEPGQAIDEEFYRAVKEFYSGTDQPLVRCPKCLTITTVQQWQSKPHLGFAHLAFKFWNWPPLDSDSWEVDIPRIIADELQHKIVLTYGHV